MAYRRSRSAQPANLRAGVRLSSGAPKVLEPLELVVGDLAERRDARIHRVCLFPHGVRAAMTGSPPVVRGWTSQSVESFNFAIEAITTLSFVRAAKTI